MKLAARQRHQLKILLYFYLKVSDINKIEFIMQKRNILAIPI